MPRTSQTIDINVSADNFYKVISNYEALPEFMPELEKVTIDSREGDAVVITYQVNLIKRIRYTLRLVHHSNRDVRWSLVKGDIMKKNEGRWLIEELGENSCRATYEIEMGFPLLVPKRVVQGLQAKNLPKVLSSFKARAEQLFG